MSRNSIFYKAKQEPMLSKLFWQLTYFIMLSCVMILAYATYHNNKNLFHGLFNTLAGSDVLFQSDISSEKCKYNEINLDIAMDVANVIYSGNRALVLTKTHHGTQEILLIDLCSGDVINKTKLILKQEQDAGQHVYNEYTG